MDTPAESIEPIDLVIAHITEEPVRPNSDDGSLDIWLQAELHFLGTTYVIVAEPVGWDSEHCTLYRIDKDELAVINLPPDESGLIYQTGDTIPALCVLAYADAEIRQLREDHVVDYYRRSTDGPLRVHADLA